MRLVPVKAAQTRLYLICVQCGCKALETEFYADLNGRPFVDYYCIKCARSESTIEVNQQSKGK